MQIVRSNVDYICINKKTIDMLFNEISISKDILKSFSYIYYENLTDDCKRVYFQAVKDNLLNIVNRSEMREDDAQRFIVQMNQATNAKEIPVLKYINTWGTNDERGWRSLYATDSKLVKQVVQTNLDKFPLDQLFDCIVKRDGKYYVVPQSHKGGNDSMINGGVVCSLWHKSDQSRRLNSPFNLTVVTTQSPLDVELYYRGVDEIESYPDEDGNCEVEEYIDLHRQYAFTDLVEVDIVATMRLYKKEIQPCEWEVVGLHYTQIELDQFAQCDEVISENDNDFDEKMSLFEDAQEKKLYLI